MGAEQDNAVPHQPRFVQPPGYTPCPDVLLDELISTGSLAETKVTLALVHHTFSFEGGLALTRAELQRRTGLSRPSTEIGLREALARGYVVRNWGSGGYDYSLKVAQ